MPPPILQAIFNPAMFALRQTLRYRRQGYREGPLDLGKVSPRLREQLSSPRVQALAARYGVDAYRDHLAHAAYTKSLFACDVLDRVPAGLVPWDRPRETATALDVGTKNFESAPGLWGALQQGSGLPPQALRLVGVEIDAYVIYRNLYSRADAAAYYAGLLPGEAHYVPGDVRTVEDRFDLVTCFFPFLTESPLLWWGLPRRFLNPEAFFAHVCARVLPGGLLLVVNHSDEEREIQRALFAAKGLSPWAATFDDLVGRRGQPLHVFAVRML